MRLISESEWYGTLREELELADTFFERVRAVGRVAARYALRFMVFALALAGLIYLVLFRVNAG